MDLIFQYQKGERNNFRFIEGLFKVGVSVVDHGVLARRSINLKAIQKKLGGNWTTWQWWKTRVHDFITVEDSELWDVICDGPFIPVKAIGEPTVSVPKTRKEYNDADRKSIDKNFRAKKILNCGIGPDEYNGISACQSTKEIWEALQIAHEGTTQVKQSKIDMLTTEYELFKIKDDESIQDIHTRFTSIINELHSLGEIIPRNKLVRKILSVLPGSWESKVNAITEVKDLQKLTIDELIEIEVFQRGEDPASQEGMTYVISAGSQDISSRIVPFSTGPGDSSSESGEDDAQDDTSMMAVESEAADYDSIFALMAKSDDDEDNDDDEVNFLDVQRNLKPYSQKKLISLENILIDAYHNLINDKNALTIELGEIENESDDLVIVVADLKETIEDLMKEKSVLIKKVEDVENERDDLLVVVMDLKETIEELKRGNSSMTVQKSWEVASEAHIKLENELKYVKSSLCAELERNRQLQEDICRVKNDLEKSLKWTWSSDIIVAMYTSNGGNMQGVGFQKEKTPYNPHRKYVTVPGNWLYTHCGNTGHFIEN
ncbi:kinetochore protein SLK19-like [Nicotiana tomentosiformis]|uniref:kinetochore protein SLK19-like n=1 Tax=Nicotiana tomentosiformis TaxID=4098 RepID=UPI00388C7252